jgi:signal transduction histidine kinase
MLPLSRISWRRLAPFGTGLLAVAVLFFSVWLVWTFLAVLQFRDNLIDREYEGSLSTNLGFLVALSSEAARGVESREVDDPEREMIETALLEIRQHLATVTPLVGEAGYRGVPIILDETRDELALRWLLADPALAQKPLSELGLQLETESSLVGYPYLRSAGGARSFVFVPAASVDPASSPPGLSTRRRLELVFSRIAALRLEELLGRIDQPQIQLGYFIGCSDFAHLVFREPHSGPSFSPLRSFVDRTYFEETRANKEMRVSHVYLDVTGGGFVRTYSLFVENRELQLCGMLAIDSRVQTVEDFWQTVGLGMQREWRDFELVIYSLESHEFEPRAAISEPLRIAAHATFSAWGDAQLRSIEAFTVDHTKIFTVPIGEGKLGLFIFRDEARRARYYFFLSLGFLVIVAFVLMVWLTASGHRAAVAAERLQEQVLENLHGGFVIVDRDGSILGSTSRFRQMVDVARTEGMIDRYLTPESADEYRKQASDESFQFAGSLQTTGQGVKPVIIAGAPITLPGVSDTRMLILIPSSELEQTIAKKFLNIFSHALKSPVHSILLIADLFRRRNARLRFPEYYSKLYLKVQEFRALTDNVLRFASEDVQVIEVDLIPINAAQVLRQVLSDARQRASLAGLKFSEQIPGSLRVLADPGLLQVVINNLVDNALKYTKAGCISVRAVDRLSRIEILVEDSGPGVPENERERIFNLFVRGANATSEQEGLGIGLYISRLYVEAMGGSLRYEPIHMGETSRNQEPEMIGSRFVIEFQRSSGRSTSE